jgi:hypothetical protein
MPPRYAFRLEDLRVFQPRARELSRVWAQGRHPEHRAVNRAIRLHAPDVARAAVAVPEMRSEGPRGDRGRVPAAGLKTQVPYGRVDPSNSLKFLGKVEG